MSKSRRLAVWKGSCLAAGLAFLLVAGTAVAQQEQEQQRQQQQRQQQAGQQQAERNIIDTLREQGNFTRLLELLRAAKLDETLTQRGPFTLLAPTDEAFQQIPQDQLNQLRQNEEQLKKLLQRHVVQGELTAAEIARQGQINPLEGGAIQVQAGGQQTGQAQSQRERELSQARQQGQQGQQQRELSQQQRERERETPVRQGQEREQQQARSGQQGQLPQGIRPDDQIVMMLIPKNDPSGVKIIQLNAQELQQSQVSQLISQLQQARPGQPEQVGVRESDQSGMTLMIGSAKVTQPNIRATNGIIHAINKVLTQENTQQR